MSRSVCLRGLVRRWRPRGAFLMSLLVLLLAVGQSGADVHPVEMVWTLNGQPYRANSAGDVNGDGFDDVIVRFSQDETYRLFLGSASGLATTPVSIVFAPSHCGYDQPGSAGDVNGDGYADVIVGACEADVFPGGDEGRVYVFMGSASGLETTASWTVEGTQLQETLGAGSGSAGDVNGDGYSDVIIGSSGYSNGQFHEGAAFVYMGSPSGLATTPAWTVEGNQRAANFGYEASTAGDVNGDGYSDVIVGAPGFNGGEGKVVVYLGSATGLSTTPAWTPEFNPANGSLGVDVDTAGDVNGDGYSDVIIGASGYSNPEPGEGAAFMYLGSPSGLAATPAWTIEFNIPSMFIGAWLDPVGDVNGDGFSDVLVGAPYDGNEQLLTDKGAAWLYLGSAAGLSPAFSWEGGEGELFPHFGYYVAPAGDVDGNGRDEFFVSNVSANTSSGAVYLFTGSCATDSDLDGLCNLQDNCPNFASLDQSDTDLDGVGDACDCAVADSQFWLPPSEVPSLALSHDVPTGTTTLSWNVPLDPGGTGTLVYDVIRSTNPADFGVSATCIESNVTLDPGPPPTDSAVLAVGGLFTYLVRAENACPLGLGSVGTGSDSVARTARPCP